MFARSDEIYLRMVKPEDFPAVAESLRDWDSINASDLELRSDFRAMLIQHRYVLRPYTVQNHHGENFAICLNADDSVIGIFQIIIKGDLETGVIHATTQRAAIHPAHRGNGYIHKARCLLYGALLERAGVGMVHTKVDMNARDRTAINLIGNGFVPVGDPYEGRARSVGPDGALVNHTLQDVTLGRAGWATMKPLDLNIEFLGFQYLGARAENALQPISIEEDFQYRHTMYRPLDNGDGTYQFASATISLADLEAELGAGCERWFSYHSFGEVATRDDVLNHLRDWYTKNPTDEVRDGKMQKFIVAEFGTDEIPADVTRPRISRTREEFASRKESRELAVRRLIDPALETPVV